MTPTAEITDDQPAATIEETSISEYMEHQQLAFVLYSIGQRAIPSVVDGLAPGQRRLLYQMYSDKLTPDAKPRKSARITASTTGALHPHGHAALYGTLTHLAAPYNRVSLVNGIGSFGTSPGDTPASDRYTEARLGVPGFELVKEMADRSVPMVPSYDSETVEPVYLPARFPALLMLGAEGIATGYRTLTPEHNPREVLNVCRAQLADPDITVEDIRAIMPGPDWGTGGTIVGDQSGITDYYTTGKGKMRVRGTYHIDKADIVITEVPPGVMVPSLLSKMRELASEGIIAGIKDVSNLTDLDNGLRIVVTCKRGAKPDDVVNDLLAETDLETTFAASVVALERGRTPRWWSVKEIIAEFLTLRDEVVVSRSQSRLEKVNTDLIRARAVATVCLDKERTSKIILGSEDKDAAAAAISEAFDLDDEQGQYIVSMPLYRLTKADVLEATKRVEKLEAEAKKLERLISSRAARAKVIDSELVETLALFDDPRYDRRTRLDESIAPVGGQGQTEDVDPAEQLARWKFDPDTGVLGDSGDKITQGHQVWAVFSSGKVKTFAGGNLPKRITVTPIAPDISDLLACGIADPSSASLLMVTAQGKALRVPWDKFNPQGIAGTGVAGIKIADDDNLVAVFAVTDDDLLLTISGEAHKVTPVSDIPLKGRGGGGVGIHILRGADEGIYEAHVNRTGFLVNGTPCTPLPRTKATVKKSVSSWEHAPAALAEGTGQDHGGE